MGKTNDNFSFYDYLHEVRDVTLECLTSDKRNRPPVPYLAAMVSRPPIEILPGVVSSFSLSRTWSGILNYSYTQDVAIRNHS